jgi:two-component system OmpR family response regulator
MTIDNTVKIFLVDDDIMYLKLLEIEFNQDADISVETYATGELCLKNLNHNPDLIVLDYYLDGIDKGAMNGIQTLDKIKAIDPGIPVVMLSSQDSIDVAINCMHHKAFDYIVKSETAHLRLKKIMAAILNTQKLEKALEWYIERM